MKDSFPLFTSICVCVCVCVCDHPTGIIECSPMVRATRVQSQVESYQRLKKGYLTPLCLTLNIIKYGSCHVYHNISAIVCSGLLGMSNLALYFTHQGRLFQFHKPSLMDVSYLLLISPLKVLHCLHQVLNSHSFGYVTGSNEHFYPLC